MAKYLTLEGLNKFYKSIANKFEDDLYNAVHTSEAVINEFIGKNEIPTIIVSNALDVQNDNHCYFVETEPKYEGTHAYIILSNAISKTSSGITQEIPKGLYKIKCEAVRSGAVYGYILSKDDTSETWEKTDNTQVIIENAISILEAIETMNFDSDFVLEKIEEIEQSIGSVQVEEKGSLQDQIDSNKLIPDGETITKDEDGYIHAKSGDSSMTFDSREEMLAALAAGEIPEGTTVYIKENAELMNIVIDSELDEESLNPVQNKTVTKAINSMGDKIDLIPVIGVDDIGIYIEVS